MFRIGKEFRFEAAHRLEQHVGKCSRLHGHSYRVYVELSGDKLNKDGPQRGMLIDYDVITRDMNKLLEKFDHRFLASQETPAEFLMWLRQRDEVLYLEMPTSTAEAIAQVIANNIRGQFVWGDLLSSVTVYETAKTSATYDFA